ncbi:MAG: signal peptide peptidase SppA [Alphaproteobacteria bacterium]|nr:signal peptide peptidase SppA [Alphaproteobacteria bacterium]
MTLDSDAYVDRRRLKRGLLFWRLAALAAAAVAAVVGLARFDGRYLLTDYVARLEVDGLILHDPRRDEMLADIAGDDRVKALIVRIDSPGGTFVGSEALHRALRRVAEAKPVVAVMDGVATSGGYMAAIAADHIVAARGTITGSIGVIFQTADVTGLLDKIGIKPETFKSGPLKAQPNPFEPVSPAVRETTEGFVRELHGMFVDMVAERRGLDRPQVAAIADGRIFSGRHAVDLKLVDSIGDEAEARDWLSESRSVARTLPVRKVALKRERELWREMFDETVGKALFSERLRLDGAIAVWHPSLR